GGGGGIGDYAYLDANTENMSAYEQYLQNTYGDERKRKLNRKVQLIWDTKKFPDEYYSEVMDKMYLPEEESYNGKRIMDVEKFVFKYQWLDMEKAARAKGNRKDFFKEELIKVYPDTTVWVRDFNYSYNEPMHNQYFWHEAYGDYPVVGVNWMQAKAFCEWRTLNKNTYQKAKGQDEVNAFRLPIESEWEYAARGGLEGGTYPWGGPYTTDDRGCFLANFKPLRGDYASDNALYTVEAKSYEPNGYNLYNMAGNVSEWTNTSYDPNSYEYMSTMNPSVIDEKNKRKVIRGGSWKDVAYMLQVNTRDFEYQDSARSYIGFRTVQDFMGVSEGAQSKGVRGFR
ncbi:T9SS ring complex lipoprotein PorK/GldK, partial [Capnocytophaga cynodegmi]